MSELKKGLSLYGLIMIAIGGSVGVGIFLTPSAVAKVVQTPQLTMWVWVLGGIITLTGALTFAELGGMYPKAGGIYTFLRAAYGDLVAFLYGWATLLVINTGSLATLARAFATYFDYFIPVGYFGLTLVAVSMIVLVTIINIFTINIGELFINILTSLKVIAILALIFTGLNFAHQHNVNISQMEFYEPENLSSAFASGLIGALFSYGGWQHTTYLSGEARNGQRNIPLALMIGAAAVTVIYLLINLAYIYLIPFEELMKSSTLATLAMQRVHESWGASFIAFVIMISAFGTATIYTFGVPRIYFAMAKDGVFFEQLARLHPRFQTPVNAILIQSAWAILLVVLWGQLEKIINYVVFIDWCFFFLAAVSVFILRYRKPEKYRPYKAFGYPLIPLIFVSIVAWFILSILFNSDKSAHEQAVAGLLVLSVGVPFYKYFKSKKKLP